MTTRDFTILALTCACIFALALLGALALEDGATSARGFVQCEADGVCRSVTTPDVEPMPTIVVERNDDALGYFEPMEGP